MPGHQKTFFFPKESGKIPFFFFVSLRILAGKARPH